MTTLLLLWLMATTTWDFESGDSLATLDGVASYTQCENTSGAGHDSTYGVRPNAGQVFNADVAFEVDATGIAAGGAWSVKLDMRMCEEFFNDSNPLGPVIQVYEYSPPAASFVNVSLYLDDVTAGVATFSLTNNWTGHDDTFQMDVVDLENVWNTFEITGINATTDVAEDGEVRAKVNGVEVAALTSECVWVTDIWNQVLVGSIIPGDIDNVIVTIGEEDTTQIRLAQAPVEVIVQSPNPPIRLTHAPVEVLLQTPNPSIRLAHAALEVLFGPSTADPYRASFERVGLVDGMLPVVLRAIPYHYPHTSPPRRTANVPCEQRMFKIDENCDKH